MSQPVDTYMDVLDCVHELTERHMLREPYTVARTRKRSGKTSYITRRHITMNPPLIDQLARAANPSGGSSDGVRPAYGSQPAARLEALDAATVIDDRAARWLRQLGEDDPGSTIACIRQLAATAAGLHACARAKRDRYRGCCTPHDLEADIRHWWAWARILTGWDTPAWQPDNTCPLCAKRGGLRIRLAHYTGTCIECRETWDPDTIGLLADHIRAENTIHDSCTKILRWHSIAGPACDTCEQRHTRTSSTRPRAVAYS